jgi:hypothetical protein
LQSEVANIGRFVRLVYRSIWYFLAPTLTLLANYPAIPEILDVSWLFLTMGKRVSCVRQQSQCWVRALIRWNVEILFLVVLVWEGEE